MSKIRAITAFICVILLVIGVFSLFTDTLGSAQEYKDNITAADNFVERGLYQRAIEKYEEAMKYKSTKEIAEKNMAAYKKSYEENPSIYSDYVSSLSNIIREYPKNTIFVEDIVALYLSREKYAEAYDAIVDAEERNASTEEMSMKKNEYRYHFKTRNVQYKDFSGFSNGAYVVNRRGFDVFYGDDVPEIENKYLYLGQLNKNDEFIAVSETDSKLINEDGMILAKFDFQIQEAGMLSDGLIPILKDGKFNYYDATGEEKFGGFDKAGNFQSGKAAVCKGGKWGIINKKGEFVVDCKYDEIVLSDTGNYLNNDVIVACENGKYYLYDSSMKKVSDFSCDYIDVGNASKDKILAYKSGSKWGFVNTNGKVIIEPKYDRAKSFSEGIGGFCENDQWGFITKDGQVAIERQFAEVDYFSKDGTCMVKNQNPVDEEKELDFSWQIIYLTYDR